MGISKVQFFRSILDAYFSIRKITTENVSFSPPIVKEAYGEYFEYRNLHLVSKYHPRCLFCVIMAPQLLLWPGVDKTKFACCPQKSHISDGNISGI